MPSTKIIATSAVGLISAAGILTGAATLANAASTTPTPSASSTATTDSESGRGGGQGPSHTPVTGAELAKVTAAVKAEDSAVSVSSVRKDEDGSYDVMGTKAGADVFLDVSKDLATITTHTGGHGGRGGGGQGPSHTPVTGAELAKVTAAVKAKDSAVSVSSVRKDEDGSYDVMGTKAGADVFLDVSKDLATITTHTGGMK